MLVGKSFPLMYCGNLAASKGFEFPFNTLSNIVLADCNLNIVPLLNDPVSIGGFEIPEPEVPYLNRSHLEMLIRNPFFP